MNVHSTMKRAPVFTLLPWCMSALVIPLASAHADDDPADGHQLCEAGSSAHERAAEALAAVDTEIESLRYGDDTSSLRAQLRELLERECFELARKEQGSSPPESESALAYRHWWENGGKRWLTSYLDPSQIEAVYEDRPAQHALSVIVPPEVPEALTPVTAPDHPLSPLFCPVDDETCGQTSSRWLEEARQAFVLRHAREGPSEARAEAEASPDPTEIRRKALAKCSEDANPWRAGTRYAKWYACIRAHAPRGELPPAGRFETPDAGWLLLRGRRGHYGFCDEIRAYHLETGTAYVVQSCSRLHLRSSGRVDQNATDDNRRTRTKTGTLPVTALRKAALFTFLSDHVESRRRAFRVPLAADLQRRWGSTKIGIYHPLGGWRTSAQTRLAWAWLEGGTVHATGHLTWPYADSAADDYAADLIQRAEEDLESGCPPAPLPEQLAFGSADPGVSSVDASQRSLDAVERRLREQLNELRDVGCTD